MLLVFVEMNPREDQSEPQSRPIYVVVHHQHLNVLFGRTFLQNKFIEISFFITEMNSLQKKIVWQDGQTGQCS